MIVEEVKEIVIPNHIKTGMRSAPLHAKKRFYMLFYLRMVREANSNTRSVTMNHFRKVDRWCHDSKIGGSCNSKIQNIMFCRS